MKKQNQPGGIVLLIVLITILFSGAFAILCLAFFIAPKLIINNSFESVISTPTLTKTTCPQVPSNWQKEINEEFIDDQNFWFPGTYQDEHVDVNTQIVNSLFNIDIIAKQGGFYSTEPYINATAQDFYMSVFARRVSGPIDSGYGITFRIIGDQLLFFRIQDSGIIHVYARDMDLNWLPVLLNNQVVSVKTEELNELVVFVQKDHFVFCLNNFTVGEIYNSNYPLGQLGIGVDLITPDNNNDFQVKLNNVSDKAKFEFDNFIVYLPPKP